MAVSSPICLSFKNNPKELALRSYLNSKGDKSAYIKSVLLEHISEDELKPYLDGFEDFMPKQQQVEVKVEKKKDVTGVVNGKSSLSKLIG